MNLIPFEKSKGVLIKNFHQTVKQSGNVILPEDARMDDWQRLTNDRQILNCLQKGELVEGPMPDENGNHKFIFQRLAVGIYIRVTAILFKHSEGWKIFVSRVERRV